MPGAAGATAGRGGRIAGGIDLSVDAATEDDGSENTAISERFIVFLLALRVSETADFSLAVRPSGRVGKGAELSSCGHLAASGHQTASLKKDFSVCSRDWSRRRLGTPQSCSGTAE